MDTDQTKVGSRGTRRIFGGALGVLGFLLSPLSWWNDLLINVPIALAFAWVMGFVFPSAFLELALAGYWLSNVLGFVFLHLGAQLAVTQEAPKYTWKSLLRDLAVSLFYTAVIFALIKFELIRPPIELEDPGALQQIFPGAP
jgi:hypothetical protein